jgi:hypothetical protein
MGQGEIARFPSRYDGATSFEGAILLTLVTVVRNMAQRSTEVPPHSALFNRAYNVYGD